LKETSPKVIPIDIILIQKVFKVRIDSLKAR